MSTSDPFTVQAAAITDVGLVRRQNEDRFLCDPERRLFGVADGVGGLPGGARAARAALAAVSAHFDPTAFTLATDWRGVIATAHQAVVEVGKTFGGRTGIATTLTVGTLQAGNLLLAHIGDSRCLLLRNGGIRCLTTDHSAVNEAKLDPSHPPIPPQWQEALARCLGQPDALRPDFITQSLRPGDLLLFSTDGVTRVIGEKELGELLTKPGPAEDRLAELIDLAYERGAPDNATAVLVELLPDDL